MEKNGENTEEKSEDSSVDDSFEDNFSKELKKKILRNRIIKGGIVLLVLVFVAGGMYLFKSRKQAVVEEAGKVDVAPVEIPEDATDVFVNDVSGVSPAIEKPKGSSTPDGVVLKSENFQIKEVSFGGNAALFSGEAENMALKISDVRSEVLTNRDGSSLKLLISWKTNKLSRSEVEYDGGGIVNKLSEGGFGFSHALVLSNLEHGKRYVFVINGFDRWGNIASSENFNVFTGNKAASVFTLIAQQFNDMFGWAIHR